MSEIGFGGFTCLIVRGDKVGVTEVCDALFIEY